jgi:hypothetical protein
MAEDDGKQGDLKYYQNQPYDMEVDLNNDEEEGDENEMNLKKEKKEENLEDQQEQEDANYQEEVAVPKVKDLPKFDISKFDDLPASPEAKELLSIMKK